MAIAAFSLFFFFVLVIVVGGTVIDAVVIVVILLDYHSIRPHQLILKAFPHTACKWGKKECQPCISKNE